MGLDMYLRKKTYIGNQWKEPKDRIKLGIPYIKDARVSEITEMMGTWRKANHIHQWFVENVQDGKDDCNEYYVEREKLEELLGLVTKVLAASQLKEGKVKNGARGTKKGWEDIIEEGKVIADPSVAQELLPTTEGFFFGGTDYDEYYYQQCVDTKEMLEGLLAEPETGEFYYQSSW